MSKTAFYQQIVHQEQLHENQATEFSKDALERYEQAYSLCEEILFDIEENANIELGSDLDRQASYVIFIRLMGTMQSIRWLFLKGYYFDAAVLHRSFTENLGDCSYIHQNKGAGKKWFKDENRSYVKAGGKFKAISKVLNQEIPEEETDAFYHMLCKYVHGNRSAIVTLISEVEDEYNLEEDLKTIRFRNPATYDKNMVDSVANLPVITLLVIKEVFPEILDYDKDQITKIQHEQYEAWKSTER